MSLLRWLLCLLLTAAAGPALAHESLPLVLSVSEMSDGVYLVRQRVPPALASQVSLTLHMPPSCAQAGTQAGLYKCGKSIGGQTLSWTFDGPAPAIPTLARIEWRTGEVRTELAPPGTMQVTVPRPESAVSVSRQYLTMGIEHILSGYDHLLFLACLLWIAGTMRRILLTVTGFTLAHSLTLALSALSIIHVPVPPTEAAIALSILFLAREIAVNDRDSLVWRHPAVISSLFGLLHGLGFASALREVGLPQTQLLAGLLFFNLGVEAGQIAVVIAVMGAVALARWLYARLAPAIDPPLDGQLSTLAPRIALLSVGTLSAFWFINRATLLL